MSGPRDFPVGVPVSFVDTQQCTHHGAVSGKPLTDDSGHVTHVPIDDDSGKPWLVAEADITQVRF